jgi:hypothetical protein
MVCEQSVAEVSRKKLLKIGIDAANLRGGGGVTHLVELLRVAQSAEFWVGRVYLSGFFKPTSCEDAGPVG